MSFLYRLIIIFLFPLALHSQNEAGMWLFGGNFFYNESNLEMPQSSQITVGLQLKNTAAYFISEQNALGIELQMNFENRKIEFLNGSGGNSFEREAVSNLTPFYRKYFFSDSKLNLFAEGAASFRLSTDRSNVRTQSLELGLSGLLGAGAQLYFTKNNAIEASFRFPFFRSEILREEDFSIRFSLLRTFVRPNQAQLPKLEDKYLFVRNFYYGFSIISDYNAVGVNSNSLGFNIGFFLGDYWLFDLNFARSSSALTNLSLAFNRFSAESSVFIRLNERGLYLRPTLNFTTTRNNNNGAVLGSPIFTDNQFSVGGSIEAAHFLKSRLLFGGGVFTAYQFEPQLNAVLDLAVGTRCTYFLTEDLAIEGLARFPIAHKIIDELGEEAGGRVQLILLDFKLRAFFFQE